MLKKYLCICFVLLFLTAGCGGSEPVNESPAVDEQTESSTVVNEDDGQMESASELGGTAGEAADAETEAVEDNAAEETKSEAEVTEGDLEPESQVEAGENFVLDVFEVAEGGYAFAAPPGFGVTINAEEAELVADDADPEYGPEIFIAGGPLDGITTAEMVEFMAAGLAEDQGFDVEQPSEVTINGLTGYGSNYQAMDGEVALEGRLVVFGDDAQAVMVFGGGPADLWAAETGAEFEQVIQSITLMPLVEAAAEGNKDDKGGAVTTGEPIAVDPSAAGMACMSTADAAVSCLTATGEWQHFTEENSQLGGDFVTALTGCADGTVLMAHLFGISAFRDGEWREYADDWGTGSVDSIACGDNGDIWIAHFQGVSVLDSSGWTTYPSELLEGVDDPTGLVDDVAVAADGTVWVVTSNTVAAYDGSDWTVYDEATLGDLYFFEGLMLGADQKPRVIHSSGVLVWDDGSWKEHEGDYYSAQTGSLDAQGNIWVGTFSDGLYQFSDGAWKYEGVETGLSSNSVNDVAIDQAGRIWAGTNYGLSVFDGSGWQVYRMDNSDLADNEIENIVVIGAGPQLPAAVEEPSGTMVGSLTLDGDPFSGTRVEICVESLSSYFDGDTPCSDQQLFISTETGADGSFVLADVPEGYYVITAETPDGWARLTTEYGFGSERVPVIAGEETDIGELMITTEE